MMALDGPPPERCKHGRLLSFSCDQCDIEKSENQRLNRAEIVEPPADARGIINSLSPLLAQEIPEGTGFALFIFTGDTVSFNSNVERTRLFGVLKSVLEADRKRSGLMPGPRRIR